MFVTGVAVTATFGQTTYIWTGAGDGTNLITADNWSPIGQPSGATQDTAEWDGNTATSLLINYGSVSLPDTGFGTMGINLVLTPNQSSAVTFVNSDATAFPGSTNVGVYSITNSSSAAALTFGTSESSNTNLFNIICRPAAVTHPFVNNSSAPATINGSVRWQADSAAGYTLDFMGTGNWICNNYLRNDNNSGPTTIQVDGPGTVFWSATGYLGNSAIGSVNIYGGTLILKSAGLLTSQPIVNNATLIFDATGQSQTLSGVISGTGALQVNSGTLTLSGTSPYVGSTTVSGGTLLINGAAGAGGVTVLQGTLLGGIGSVSGPVTANTGGNVGAGNSSGLASGVLTLAQGLNLSGGGVNIWDLTTNSTSGAGSAFDQVVVSGGTLTLGGASRLLIRFGGAATRPTNTVPFWQSSRSWKVVALTGNASNPGNSNFASLTGTNGITAGIFSTSVDTNGNVFLDFDPLVTQLTNTLQLGTSASLVVNQLDHGSNSLVNVFGSQLPDLTLLTIFSPTNCAVSNSYYYDTSLGLSPSNWYLDDDATPVDGTKITLAPGVAAFITPGEPFTLRFTGTPHVPVLPVALSCGYGHYYFLGRQTNDIGTYENVTGLTPTAGAQVARWTGNAFTTYTYSGLAWTPSTPILSVNEAARLFIPVPGSGLTVICPTNKTVPCGAGCVGQDRPAKSILWNFGGKAGDGTFPNGDLIEGLNGMLFGTTSEGGTNDLGTIFTIAKDGTGYRVLHTFGSVVGDGSYPLGELLRATDGFLYGTTYEGGTNGWGTAFKMNPDGTGYQLLHAFGSSVTDGVHPFAGLIQGQDGALYGTTYEGGTNDLGTTFKINRDGSGYVEVHAFGATISDGQNPCAGLMQASDGKLYGTTLYGGPNDAGVVYQISTNGTIYTLLHTFGNSWNDGQNPEGGLVEGSDGNLYGTTYYGGSNYLGTVYKISKNGTNVYALLHSFSGFIGDGWNPGASLTKGCGGAFYSTTEAGGENGAGVVFALNEDGSGYELLHGFVNTNGDAQVPESGVLVASDGALYGTGFFGGNTGNETTLSGDGALYKLYSPSAWTFDLPTVTNGCQPVSIVVLNTLTNGPAITRTWLISDGCGNSNTCSQTVSQPCGGYSVPIYPGYNPIAVQLDTGGDTLNEVLPVVPNGTLLYKYVGAISNWVVSRYDEGLGSWEPPNLTLAPGEGAFLQSSTTFTLSFNGTPHVPVLPLTGGLPGLLSRQTNDIGNYQNITGYSPTNGAQLFAWDNPSGAYLTYTFSNNNWTPSTPSVPVGQAVWIAPSGGTPSMPPQGYAVDVPAGYSLIANQLDHGSNTLNEILPVVPDGSVFYKYINSNGNWLASTYSAAAGWSSGGLKLGPGEGAFFQSPQPFTLTFTGTPHVPVLPVAFTGVPHVPVLPIVNLLSRQTNGIGTYENITGMSPTNGTQLFTWDNGIQSYITYTYSNTWSPTIPSVPVGQAVWIAPGGGLPPVAQNSYPVHVQPGYNLIANQLDHGSNTLNEIMPVVPDGTVFYKYDNSNANWIASAFSASNSSWLNGGTIALNPGEGAFLQSSSAFILSFTGNPHVPVLPFAFTGNPHVPVLPIVNLVSRQTNDIGLYENIVGTAPTNGAQMFKWDSSNSVYTVYGFSNIWSPSVPSAAVGESVWIAPGGGVPPAPPLSYPHSFPAGVSLIANQLDHGSNTLNEVFGGVPDSSTFYKYNNSNQTWTISSYSAAAASWGAGNAISINPGEGAFFQTPAAFTLLFVGNPHVPVLPINLPVGPPFLLSRQTNDIAYYTNIIGTTPPNRAKVFKWNGSGFASAQYSTLTAMWSPSEPSAAVGEALWFNASLTAPVLQQAGSKPVVCGSAWTFDVPAFVNPCGGSNIVSVLSTVTNGGPCPAVITRTWQISDACGDIAILSQTVTLNPQLQTVLAATLASGTNINLFFPTLAGLTYVVEYKNSLSQTSWTTLSTVPGTGSNGVVLDQGPLPSSRYYRVREVVP